MAVSAGEALTFSFLGGDFGFLRFFTGLSSDAISSSRLPTPEMAVASASGAFLLPRLLERRFPVD